MVVQCTWKTSDGKDLNNTVIWTSDESKQSTNIEEEVEAENCHLLVAPNTGSAEYLTVPACQLLLSCQPPNQIVYLSVLSEARVIELYGHHGEYIETIHNTLLDEVDDMPVYRGDIKLLRPLQVCSIKFANLKTKEEMWLYGVKAITTKAKDMLDNTQKIQYPEVERRLQEMGTELSQKAEAFKQLVFSHQQNVSKFDAGQLNNLAQMLGLLHLSQQQASPFDAKYPAPANVNIENAAANILNQNTEKLGNNNQEFVPAEGLQSTQTLSFQSSSTQTDPMLSPEPKIDLNDMKEYFDLKFQELEKMTQERIEKRLKEMETKLLCKLDGIEYFIKPVQQLTGV